MKKPITSPDPFKNISQHGARVSDLDFSPESEEIEERLEKLDDFVVALHRMALHQYVN